MTPSPTVVLAHAPMWVWGLLAGLTALGLSQARDRLVRPRVALVIPALMLLLSLNALRTAFGLSGTPLSAWLLGVAGGAGLVAAVGWPRGITWQAGRQRLAVPGSLVPLALFLALFALKFCVGTALALRADATRQAGFVPGVALGYGAFSGVFLARAVAMWRALPAPLGRLRAFDASVQP